MSELLPSRQNEGYGACGNGGPGEAQRQRVRRGEEEQRSDCAFRPQGGNKGCGACDDEGGGLFPKILLLGAASDFELLISREVPSERLLPSINPSAARNGRHLPLHKGGFAAYRPSPLPARPHLSR